jgi:hypothetical protein
MAQKHSRPYLHIDLTKIGAFDAAKKINAWIESHRIETLNVAGPRSSKDPKIYQGTFDLLQTTLYLNLMEDVAPGVSRVAQSLDELRGGTRVPHTVNEAVETLIKELSFKDKASLAKMTEEELNSLHLSMGHSIRERFRLWSKKSPLMESCRSLSRNDQLTEDDASVLLIRELWKAVQKSYRMRVVK